MWRLILVVKYLGALSLSILCVPVNANLKQHDFKISTYINKVQMFPYSVEINAIPEKFVLVFDSTNQRFFDEKSELTVVSDIPDDGNQSFQYQLSLSRNTSFCKALGSDDIVLNDVMNVFIDDEPLEEGGVSLVSEFDQVNEGGMRFGVNQLTLRSEVIHEKALQCKGAITLDAELAL